MTRSAAMRSQGGAKPAGEAPVAPAFPPAPAPAPIVPVVPVVPPKPPSLPPSVTLPPTTIAKLKVGADTARTKAKRDEAPSPGPRAKAEKAALELVLDEVRAIREAQQALLEAIEALRQRPSAPAEQHPEGHPQGHPEDEGPALSPIRARRQKTVLLVDDDPQTREAAVAELLRANVPVRAYPGANAAVAAIAEEKPDVIALELGIDGDMAGRDLVNMIKATMEWVDVPIILWTREGVANQKEARQIHGADEVVLKSAGPAALVARVITVFRRG